MNEEDIIRDGHVTVVQTCLFRSKRYGGVVLFYCFREQVQMTRLSYPSELLFLTVLPRRTLLNDLFEEKNAPIPHRDAHCPFRGRGKDTILRRGRTGFQTDLILIVIRRTLS